MTAIAVEPYFTAKGEMSGQPMVLDDVRLAVLWDRMSQFGSLFATAEEMSFPVFRDWLEDPGTLIIGFYHKEEREPVGLGMVYGLVPSVDVKIQISFFDGKLERNPKGGVEEGEVIDRKPIVRAFIGWVFDTVKTRRVSAHLRHDTEAVQFFLLRVGMCLEGRLKDWVERDGKHFDLYLYGVTERECTPAWRGGQSSAQPRVRMMKRRSVTHGQGVPEVKDEDHG